MVVRKGVSKRVKERERENCHTVVYLTQIFLSTMIENGLENNNNNIINNE